MFLTVHASAGIFLGSQLHSPWLAFGLGYFSHLLLDLVPHGDEQLAAKNQYPETQRKWRLFYLAGLDTLGLITLFWLLTSSKSVILTPAILWGMLGAVAPDYLWGLHKIIPLIILKPIHRLHNWFHHLLNYCLPFPFGIIIQLVTLGYFIYLIIYSPSFLIII